MQHEHACRIMLLIFICQQLTVQMLHMQWLQGRSPEARVLDQSMKKQQEKKGRPAQEYSKAFYLY